MQKSMVIEMQDSVIPKNKNIFMNFNMASRKQIKKKAKSLKIRMTKQRKNALHQYYKHRTYKDY